MNEASEIAVERFDLNERVEALESMARWAMWGLLAAVGLMAIERLLADGDHDGE